MKRIHMTAAVLVAMLTAVQAFGESDITATARKLHKTHQESVVWVMVVAKVQLSAGGRTVDREQKAEARGTVIDPSGLTVVSYSALDPGMQMQGMRARGGGKIQTKTNFAEVKIHMADGTEIPAKVVLKDTVLDLAFIVPDMESEEAEGVEFTPVDLKTSIKPTILDETIALGRLGKALDRRPTVLIGRIAAVIKKPRDFYVATSTSLGGPVFSADGAPFGIVVRRMANGRPGAAVILPAEDVLETAAQALEKIKAKKKETDKPDESVEDDKIEEKPDTAEKTNPDPSEKAPENKEE